MGKWEDVVGSAEVNDFRRVAADVVALIRSIPNLGLEPVCVELETHLHELVLRMMQLPDIPDRFAPARSGTARPGSLELYKEFAQPINERLGAAGIFRVVVSPHEPDEQAVNSTLGDDFGDIVCDVLPGLERWPEADTAERLGILYDWQLGHDLHWGYHVLWALTGLYSFRTRVMTL